MAERDYGPNGEGAYHGTPKQRALRAMRNRARRKVGLKKR